jgi:hypothetical protein
MICTAFFILVIVALCLIGLHIESARLRRQLDAQFQRSLELCDALKLEISAKNKLIQTLERREGK